MSKALYICYFGVREPLVQTQVLPYVRELGTAHEMFLLTFEPDRKPDDIAEFAAIESELAAEGIRWNWLPYHRRFSAFATAWDIARGAYFVWTFIGREHPDILHGRVHVPALMADLGRRFSLRKPKLLFDIRGFFPEEYVDAGIWPHGGLLYRLAKFVESRLLRDADGFVLLTEKARHILFPESATTGYDKKGRPVEVIPCCVDISRFTAEDPGSRQGVRREMDLDGRLVIAYVGAFGGWYLAEETAEFLASAREKDSSTFAMILTQSDPQMITRLLSERGYTTADMFVKTVAPREIPRYLSAADIAVSFIKPSYSKQASSPTKNAEYLACGLPIIANTGIGDVDQFIENHKVGALVREFSKAGYIQALNEIEALGDVKERCRLAAAQEFSLETVAGERYRKLYRRILKG